MVTTNVARMVKNSAIYASVLADRPQNLFTNLNVLPLALHLARAIAP